MGSDDPDRLLAIQGGSRSSMRSISRASLRSVARLISPMPTWSPAILISTSTGRPVPCGGAGGDARGVLGEGQLREPVKLAHGGLDINSPTATHFK
ncbi:hypothetical protein WMF45_31155 [Sorangium sp. So ce448]|uniref:hypothetical protein n=1 Tax=Sorangium sp. So ce448 TaxID=3133314 RepID=UPI003F5ECB5C